MKRAAVVGTGRLGTALAGALVEAGYPLAGLADADISAARRARRLVRRGTATDDPSRTADKADLVFLCVPDAAIRPVAAALARSDVDWTGKIVFHASGLVPASALGPLRARGASTAAFHPIQSFPGRTQTASSEPFRNIFVGLEGGRRAVAAGSEVARALGARPLSLGGRDKSLYHAACSVASNLLVPLFDLACEALVKAGFPPSRAGNILLPLLEGTLQSVKRLNRPDALTGPIARGDEETVRRHLRALGRIPRAEAVYRLLARQALDLVARKGIRPEARKRIKALLEERRLPPRARARTSP